MSRDDIDDIVQAQMRKKDIEEYHLRIVKELYPKGTHYPHPKKNKYKPKDVISMRDWDVHRRRYRLLFAPLHIKIDVIEKYLNDFYRNWKDGVYPTSEKFLETLDDIFIEFANMLKTKNQKFYTDIQTYDDLLEKFQKITSKIKHISPGDKEIGQKILREQATEVQERIERYLKQREQHGHELTDEMLAFKGLQTILDDLHFETVLKPQLPKFEPPEYNVSMPEPESPPKESELQSQLDDVTAELRNARTITKNTSREKNKLKSALKHLRHKPNQMEMKEIIDRNRFKNGKCNNTKVGKELAIDGETAFAWIKKIGLSDYAYNPNHLK